MRLSNSLIRGAIVSTVASAFAPLPYRPQDEPVDVSQDDSTMTLSHVLNKRDAFTCYGGNASVPDCQAALDQVQHYGDQVFKLYSGLCLNWSQDTCNVRFCAQPYIKRAVTRTASWIYNWANSSLMGCVRGDQYAVMGDSLNLNGNEGTYRLHLEQKTKAI
ncbi:hypothetical protein F5Y19DRAFT_460346 [Xylariaceae sp. FL1651]|nr:hypothetical protein F5Y19DRAFT_460346 [Xylariaceae sp. FL1651]